MEVVNKNHNKLEYFAILFMVICCGSQFFFRFHGAVTMISFFLFSVFYHFKSTNKEDKRSKKFIIIYTTFLVFNFICNNIVSRDINRILPYIIFGISSYLILSRMSFDSLSLKLMKVVLYLSIISFIVFILCEIGSIGYSLITYNGEPYLMCGINVIGWSEPFHRFAGIFWEPGANQIIINWTIFIVLLSESTFEGVKKHKKYLLILVLMSLATMSTTGYFTLILILIYAYSKFYGFRKLSFGRIIAVSLMLPTIMLIYNSDAVQEKLHQGDNLETRSSFTVRLADNVAMIEMIKERPLMGFGVGSLDFQKRSLFYDNETSSNGDLFFMTIFGIPFFLFILINCYSWAKVMGHNPYWVCLMFVFFNIGECFLYYPLIFTLLIKQFKNTNSVYESSSNHANQA